MAKITKKDAVSNIVKWSIPIIACVVIYMAADFISKAYFNNDNTAKLEEQNSEIAELQNSIDVLKEQYSDLQTTTDNTNSLIVYNGSDDDNYEAAVSFFEKITTWSDSTTYESLREEMLQKGYDKDSSIMQVLFPEEAISYVTQEDGNYKQVTEIDEKKLNMQFKNLDVYRLSVDGSVYNYAAILQVTSKDLSGESTSYNVQTQSVYLTYSFVDGTITNIEGYALTDR